MEETHGGISLGDARITNLDFADDVVIFVETLEALLHALDTLSMESKLLRLKVFWIKTKKFGGLLDRNVNIPPPDRGNLY